MLIEIFSDKFISNGKIREKIKLHSGLNIISGDSNKSNSIGKSTMLMIIDFCFGGSDYVTKGSDIINNIGHHSINFAFKFHNKLFYFSRHTDKPNTVFVCNKFYEIIEGQDFSLNKFTDWLKKSYDLNINLSFRDIVSKYFRVYGRDVTKELKPLAVSNEAEEKSIKRLLKLYGYDFTELEKKVSKELQVISSFNNLEKNGFQEKIGKRKYNQNVKEISEKKNNILEITDNFIGTKEAEQIANLKFELQQLKRQKNKVEDKKDLTYIKRNRFSFNESEVKDFFPEIDLKKLSEIEAFHQNISEILNAEIKEEIFKKQILIENLSNQISIIESKLSEFSKIKDISRKQLSFIIENQRIIDKLEENNIFNKREELKLSKESSTDRLNDYLKQSIDAISKVINRQMKLLNSTIFGSENRIPPKIEFKLNKQKKWTYEFKTENDTGTGTAFKSLILFDLTVFKQTELPSIIHDSYLFTDIETSTVSEIVKIYNTFNKQIFIALTDKTSFDNKDILDILKKNEVLYLSQNGNELFGKSWKEI
ncbi:TPA: DUF2326 domain-containing protein [Streptococcus agalactiae]